MDAKSSRPVVNVLLSYYKGEQFIRDQIDSIASQRGCEVVLHVRNDGPHCMVLSDLLESTRGILNIQYSTGPNLGFAGSFIELLRNRYTRADYFAFCDQDDVWPADRLSNAIACLESEAAVGPSSPIALYAAGSTLIDEVGAELGRLRDFAPANPYSALAENTVPGHLMVLTPALAEVAASLDMNRICAHDWACQIAACCYGTARLDSEATGSLYRQHASNMIGVPLAATAALRRGLAAILAPRAGQRPSVFTQCEAVRDAVTTVFGRAAPRSEAVDLFLSARFSFRKRLALVLSHRFRRRDVVDNLAFEAHLLFGWYY
jgi:Glycosyl transferase family 2